VGQKGKSGLRPIEKKTQKKKKHGGVKKRKRRGTIRRGKMGGASQRLVPGPSGQRGSGGDVLSRDSKWRGEKVTQPWK